MTATAGLDSLRKPARFALSSGVTIYALVLSDGPVALELFATSSDAETAFAQVVRDEPDFRELLEVRELATNLALDWSDRCSFN